LSFKNRVLTLKVTYGEAKKFLKDILCE